MERKEIFQYKYTTTIPRENFIKYIVENEGLDLDDLRVCMLLLTELDGWDINRKEVRMAAVDPLNYRTIDIEKIAKTLHIKKKDVKESLKVLIREGIIEKGESRTSTDAYRFTF